MRILMTTIELFFKFSRYSWAFRERAWLGKAHRQLPTRVSPKRNISPKQNGERKWQTRGLFRQSKRVELLKRHGSIV